MEGAVGASASRSGDLRMIRLHRLNGVEVVVNAELIECVEAHGQETVLALATGNKIIVKETMADVVSQALEYRRKVYVNATYLPEFLKRAVETPAESKGA